MSESLRVDPGALHAGGTQIGVAADSAADAFATHQRRIEDAMAGWSPAARAAMEQKVTSWGAIHEHVTAGVRAHAESIQAAARGYAQQDTANADAVRAKATNLD